MTYLNNGIPFYYNYVQKKGMSHFKTVNLFLWFYVITSMQPTYKVSH